MLARRRAVWGCVRGVLGVRYGTALSFGVITLERYVLALHCLDLLHNIAWTCKTKIVYQVHQVSTLGGD